jgi:hypothetical protein
MITTQVFEIDESIAGTSAEAPAKPSFTETSDAEAPAGPADHEIAVEAYTRYLLRGCQDGHALEDWLAAEESLREKYR